MLASEQTSADAVYKRFTVSKIQPGFGAEVHGITLAELDDDTFTELHDAFLRFKVLVIRDQESFQHKHHEELAARFGTIQTPPVALGTIKDAPGIAVIDTGEHNRPYTDFWHTDLAYKPQPAHVSILRARLLPPVGGDTLWADMGAAYEGLPDQMKERLDGLRACNSYAKTLSEHGGPADPTKISEIAKQWPPIEHPIVRTHAETGEKSIYCSTNTVTHVADVSSQESKEILDVLFRLPFTPEYQVRLKWTPHTVGIWDNRNTLHYATADYFPERRIMERAMTVGETPF